MIIFYFACDKGLPECGPPFVLALGVSRETEGVWQCAEQVSGRQTKGVIVPGEWTPSGLSRLGYRFLLRKDRDSHVQKTIWHFFAGTAIAAARSLDS